MKKQYIYGFLIILLLAGYGLYTNRTVETAPLNQEKEYQATLIAGESKTPLSFTQGQTLYDAMLKAQQNGLALELKEYPGIGYYVVSIGTLIPEGKQFLMYSINDEEGIVGISAYVLKANDIVEWQIKQ